MLTQNFRNIMALMLEAGSDNTGLLPIIDVNGTTYYATRNTNTLGAIYNPTRTFTLSNASAGIIIGATNGEPKLSDYKLGYQITSGHTGTTIVNCSLDDNGNPYIDIDLTLHRAGDDNSTITEIGYVQRVYCTTQQGSTSGAGYRYILLDRTTIFPGVWIEQGGSTIIRYTLKTILA